MFRITVISLALAICLCAQQPNASTASLTANGALGGPPYPVQLGGLRGTVVQLTLQGSAAASNTPFLAGAGTVSAGFSTLPEGLVDLDYTASGFSVVLDGLTPGSPTAPIAQLNGSGSFQVSFFNGGGAGAVAPVGLQAVVTDPAAATGLRLTAALDFAPMVVEPVAVYVGGVSAPFWSNNGGVINGTGTCIGGVFLNNDLTFMFGGPVDPSSLPTAGSASGSINIFRTTPSGPEYAAGQFFVQDDPLLPAGNQRLVVFLPAVAGSALTCNGAGLAPGSQYTVQVPDVTAGGPVVTVAGSPITRSINACFMTRPCSAANPGASFTDVSPGSPQVIGTVPAMANPAPAAIPVGSIAANTVSVTLNEGLLGGTVDITTVRLVNVTLGGIQIPGSVTYTGPGGALGPGSRIEYVAASPLAAGSTFRFEVDPVVTDPAGNPVELVPGSPGAPLLFVTQGAAPTPQPPLTENFNSSASAAQVGSLMTWGGGALSIAGLNGTVIGGDGSFGLMTLPPGSGTLDTGAPPSTGFAAGLWQPHTVFVAPGANVRIIGTERAHIRCSGQVFIDGTLSGNAGMSSTAPTGSPEQGPGSGGFNNGASAANSVVRGGVAGVSGGNGGRASQSGYLTRTAQGESGFGPPEAGVPNTGPSGANPTFGGGGGGGGGFRFPAGGMVGELGGLGGAGGSAWAQGGNGGPYQLSQISGLCVPLVPTVQTVALAAPVPSAMVLPVGNLSAGSGGGGGGDRFELTGAPNDDQGGGGGGGGGGLYVGAAGVIQLNPTAVITLEGADGGQGNLFFGGNGGAGSGGMLWMQSLAQIQISSSATLSVAGGSMGSSCSSHLGGSGGVGLYQFEDADGMVNASFFQPLGNVLGGANVSVMMVPGNPNTIEDTATSEFLDTGFTNPTFTGATETFVSGTTGTVTILYEAAQGSVTNPTQPNLTTVTAAVPGSQIYTLSGNRFIRMRITLSYPVVPVGAPVPTLPQVTNVVIDFGA